MLSFRDELELSDDKGRLDLDTIHALLDDTYWAAGRSREGIEKAIEGATCYGVYDDERQVAFCRVVTDGIYFAWIADLVVDPDYRGRGIGKWIMRTITDRPGIDNCQMFLQTADAHSLYERYGFYNYELMRRPAPASTGRRE